MHTDDAYKRLTRTVDLTGVSAADRPTLRTQLLWDTEPGYDNAIVEAHTTGADDWTTLPETGGATRTTVPAECEAGYYVGEHPQLEHYLTVGVRRLPRDRHHRRVEQPSPAPPAAGSR